MEQVVGGQDLCTIRYKTYQLQQLEVSIQTP